MTLLPPESLRAVLEARHLNRPPSAYPALASADALNRRTFLSVAGAGLALFGAAAHSQALVFSPQDDEPTPALSELTLPEQPLATLKLGEIPADFWLRPRELWLRRQGTKDDVRVVYWKDGKLLSEGYWRACAMLRDVNENVMTTMDPSVLDVLRGVSGYYNAWNYRKPLILTSGFRTLKTNRALSKEKAALNSMHLYGKAVDLYIEGIPAKDIGALGKHLKQGGVGFYPSRGFTHLDTGRLRTWVG
jgi:uncharacterized protein YcbK (DUF882 family)